MPIAFAAEETIERPVDEVWAALTDWANAPNWMNGVEAMRADGETVAGTTLTFHARGRDRPSRIQQCDPGRSITLRSVQGSVTADYAYELQPIDTGSTRIVLVARCESTGMLWALLFPFLRFAMRRVDGGQLANLKHRLET